MYFNKTKIDENSGNFCEHFCKSFCENANSVIFTTYFSFLRTFCQLFYFKMPTLVNNIQTDAPFTKYSTSIMIPQLVSIFVKNICENLWKFLYFHENVHENFTKMRKLNIRFGHDGNWILTLPHIYLFYPPKMRYYAKKITPHGPCMLYHCQM
jgi:hypothetical protein